MESLGGFLGNNVLHRFVLPTYFLTCSN